MREIPPALRWIGGSQATQGKLHGGQYMPEQVAAVVHPAFDHRVVFRRVQLVFFERRNRPVYELAGDLLGRAFSTIFAAAIL